MAETAMPRQRVAAEYGHCLYCSVYTAQGLYQLSMLSFLLLLNKKREWKTWKAGVQDYRGRSDANSRVHHKKEGTMIFFMST